MQALECMLHKCTKYNISKHTNELAILQMIGFYFLSLAIGYLQQQKCYSKLNCINSYEPTRQYLGATELNTAGRRAKI